jgi:hypothetical protein
MLDFTAPKGLRYYFKCAFLAELPDEALKTILHYARIHSPARKHKSSLSTSTEKPAACRRLRRPLLCAGTSTA